MTPPSFFYYPNNKKSPAFSFLKRTRLKNSCYHLCLQSVHTHCLNRYNLNIPWHNNGCAITVTAYFIRCEVQRGIQIHQVCAPLNNRQLSVHLVCLTSSYRYFYCLLKLLYEIMWVLSIIFLINKKRQNKRIPKNNIRSVSFSSFLIGFSSFVGSFRKCRETSIGDLSP
jgi:hypothetical protein